MAGTFLLTLFPNCAKDAAKCIYNEFAHDICPLLYRCFGEYFDKKFGPNRGQANADQPEGQTEGQVNADQPECQTGGQANAGQPGGQMNPGQSSSGGRMLFARYLDIEHSKNKDCWRWVDYPSEPRFKKVAELKYVYWLIITAWINFSELTPKTKYAAYLIFRTTADSNGLGTFQQAFVSVGEDKWIKEVCLKPTEATSRARPIGLPVKRLDGWMELELGQFYCDDGDDEAEISIKETSTKRQKEDRKTGLIVAGIEIRPI